MESGSGIESRGASKIYRVGDYILGPSIGVPPECMSQHLARRDGTDEYFIVRALSLQKPSYMDEADYLSAKRKFQTEEALLSFLKDESGVVNEHGIIRATVPQTAETPRNTFEDLDVDCHCLILDCYETHDFAERSRNNLSLFDYVNSNNVSESERIRIFYKVVRIVKRLHELHVVHQDLRLANIIVNKATGSVTLSNFCLGTHLTDERELCHCDFMSLAYSPPEVRKDEAHLGPPADMWSLGVVLYLLIFGKCPFMGRTNEEINEKAIAAEYVIPTESIFWFTSRDNRNLVLVSADTQRRHFGWRKSSGSCIHTVLGVYSDVDGVSSESIEIIKSLLVVNPDDRLTASETLEKLRAIIEAENVLKYDPNDQVVPSLPRPPENLVENEGLELVRPIESYVHAQILQITSMIKAEAALEERIREEGSSAQLREALQNLDPYKFFDASLVRMVYDEFAKQNPPTTSGANDENKLTLNFSWGKDRKISGLSIFRGTPQIQKGSL